jgi:hypothetical protein
MIGLVKRSVQHILRTVGREELSAFEPSRLRFV